MSQLSAYLLLTLAGMGPMGANEIWGPPLASSLAPPLFPIHFNHLLDRSYTPQCLLLMSATVTVIKFDSVESLPVISVSA